MRFICRARYTRPYNDESVSGRNSHSLVQYSSLSYRAPASTPRPRNQATRQSRLLGENLRKRTDSPRNQLRTEYHDPGNGSRRLYPDREADTPSKGEETREVSKDTCKDLLQG